MKDCDKKSYVEIYKRQKKYRLLHSILLVLVLLGMPLLFERMFQIPFVSTNGVGKITVAGWIFVIVYLILLFLLVKFGKSWRCPACRNILFRRQIRKKRCVHCGVQL